ncbi:MAG: retropepsin-like aspartic protease [Longimicrobiaceae bacterium]
MRRSFCRAALLVLGCGQRLAAQSGAAPQAAPPVVRANAKVADVRDGGVMQRGYWTILPEVRPDVYVVRQVGSGKRVTFYTDLDSISFHVTRGSTHDFVIVLANGDSAFTRVTTVDPNRLRYDRIVRAPGATADTIPFTLGRGGKIFVRGSVNGSDTLDLMFDTGANNVVLSKSALGKGAKLTFGGTRENAAFGGTITVRESRGNVLEVGGLRWRGVPIIAIDRADGDGIIGYNVFEDRTIEVDYGRRIIVIRDSLPAPGAGYVELPTRLRNGLIFVQATLLGGGAHPGWFELDTGASWALYVGHPFAAASRFPGAMERLGERSSGGMGTGRVRTELVRVPALRLGRHELRGVPVDLERPSGEQPRGDGILGMDVLRRFDTVLDLRDYRVWLRPNRHLAEGYNESTRPSPLLLAAIGVAVAGLAFAGFRYVRRRRRGVPGP